MSGLDRFLRDIHRHASPVDHVKERVPQGTRRAGTLWVTPHGELVVLGYPHGDPECPDDGPDFHNCDEFGCGLAEHVIARGVYVGEVAA